MTVIPSNPSFHMGTQTLIFLLLEVMKGVHVKQHFHVYFDFLLNKKCKQEEFQFFFFFFPVRSQR